MSGILLVDKPKGWTSNDVCQFVKQRFRFKKVGHGGTLDPFATGLLVLYLDQATRLSCLSLNDEKIYEGVMCLGRKTSTGDSEGNVISHQEISREIDRIVLQNVFDSFVGLVWQKPPMTSAIKKNGVPLYRLARKGIEVERENRKINIYELNVKNWSAPFISFNARVSKGTYIRVLAEDIAEKLGTKAFLSELRRVASGQFYIDHAISIDRLKMIHSHEELSPFIQKTQSLACNN